MNNLASTRETIQSGAMDARFSRLYGDAAAARARYLHIADLFEAAFTDGADLRFFSAPGRTEVCGNHTDHNHGCVLAAAINLDAVACAAKTDDHLIVVKSEHYPGDTIDINGLKVVNDTLGHAAGDELICGAADCISKTFEKSGTCYRTGGGGGVV